jgi:hypothetical protein
MAVSMFACLCYSDARAQSYGSQLALGSQSGIRRGNGRGRKVCVSVCVCASVFVWWWWWWWWWGGGGGGGGGAGDVTRQRRPFALRCLANSHAAVTATGHKSTSASWTDVRPSTRGDSSTGSGDAALVRNSSSRTRLVVASSSVCSERMTSRTSDLRNGGALPPPLRIPDEMKRSPSGAARRGVLDHTGPALSGSSAASYLNVRRC